MKAPYTEGIPRVYTLGLAVPAGAGGTGRAVGAGAFALGRQDGWTWPKTARASPGSELTKRSKPPAVIFAHRPARAHIRSSKARTASARSTRGGGDGLGEFGAFQHREVRTRPQGGHQMGGVAQQGHPGTWVQVWDTGRT
jgi:hypothetical protein